MPNDPGFTPRLPAPRPARPAPLPAPALRPEPWDRPVAGPAPAGQPPPADRPARVFRAPYAGYDLHTVAGAVHVAVPKGTPCYAAPTLAEIARQISARQHPGPAQAGPAQPGDPPGPPGPET